MENRVSPDIIYDIFIPQSRYRENIVLTSLWKVMQERWVRKGGTWKTLRVPELKHGGQHVHITRVFVSTDKQRMFVS